jgi:hypothetical protein
MSSFLSVAKNVSATALMLLRMKVKGAWTDSLWFGMVVVVRVTAS